jgi:N-acetylneuraminic acid mutarotase
MRRILDRRSWFALWCLMGCVAAGVALPAATLAAPFPGSLAWELRADLPGGVHGAAGGAIADTLFVSHGFRGADSAVLDVYDVGADAWTSGASAGEARSALAGAVAAGKLYAIGGRGPTGTVEVFDPSSGTWSTVASLSEPRGGLVAASVGGLVYAIGGRSGATVGSGTIFDTTEVYDPSTDTWTLLAPMPLAVSDATATVGPDGFIYVIGGAISPGTLVGELQIYDPANDEWSLGASLPIPRAGMGAGTLCGQIVAYRRPRRRGR